MIKSFFLMSSFFSFKGVLAASFEKPPSTGQDWVSLNQGGVQFQPAMAKDPSKQRALRQAQKRFLEEEEEIDISTLQQKTSFVDSQETYWDGYAQAWRMLGFYIDCNPDYDDGRRLEEDQSSCQRYLLWAAYVDLDYQGGGIGEYQFWDPDTETWDTSACETTGNERCAKMDCHLSDTHYQLLGFFKEPGYGEFFEQLFKHQGYCAWQNGEYDFMEEVQEDWPEGCSETEVYTSDGYPLYYEMKPMAGANMTIGLYTDARCSQDYMGEEYTIDSIYGNNGEDHGDVWQTGSNIDYWNYGMRIYKQCQPCRAYALHNNYYNNDRKLEDNDPNNGLFQCDDDAGYTNVNQCMKFRTKTSMYYASFSDVVLGSEQASLLEVTVNGKKYGSNQLYASTEEEEEEEEKNESLYLLFSILTLCFGSLLLTRTVYWVWNRRLNDGSRSLKEPLI